MLPKKSHRWHSKTSHRLLFLSGDLELNPGPSENNIDIWEPLKKRGLHFIHIHIHYTYYTAFSPK